jgi:hypothetical protein
MRPVCKATGPAGGFCLREMIAVGSVVPVGGCFAACQLGHLAAAPASHKKRKVILGTTSYTVTQRWWGMQAHRLGSWPVRMQGLLMPFLWSCHKSTAFMSEFGTVISCSG